jgi:bifunctional DNA-binding transcriptional regulator/antitoxin component of YhaV-PrlF toxin-antitoxin module
VPKVTSKLQLTVPKRIADQYGIRPGDELLWIPAGESIRMELVRKKAKAGHELTAQEREALFDATRHALTVFKPKNWRRRKPKGLASLARTEAELARSYTKTVASLVDTNILV